MGGPGPLLRFAAAMAAGRAEPASRALRAARRAGHARRAAEETALMLMLHAGYPASLEALGLLHVVWPGRARARREGGVRTWRRQGARLCARIYGPVYPALLTRVRALHPDMAVWMVEQGYGRVLSRGGMSVPDRECIAVAVLAQGGWEPQLVSHLLGARRVGVSRRAIRDAVWAGVAMGGARARRAASRGWRIAFGEALPALP